MTTGNDKVREGGAQPTSPTEPSIRPAKGHGAPMATKTRQPGRASETDTGTSGAVASAVSGGAASTEPEGAARGDLESSGRLANIRPASWAGPPAREPTPPARR